MKLSSRALPATMLASMLSICNANDILAPNLVIDLVDTGGNGNAFTVCLCTKEDFTNTNNLVVHGSAPIKICYLNQDGGGGQTKKKSSGALQLCKGIGSANNDVVKLRNKSPKGVRETELCLCAPDLESIPDDVV